MEASQGAVFSMEAHLTARYNRLINASSSPPATLASNTSPSPTTTKPKLTTFSLFPTLPLELQKEIWDAAVDDIEPRVVEIMFHGRHQLLCSFTRSPALLVACYESRAAAVKKYEPLIMGKHMTRARIDWDKDVLFVNANAPTRIILQVMGNKEMLRKCRRIAMGREFFYEASFGLSRKTLTDDASKFFSQFKEIKELLVVLTTPGNHIFRDSHPCDVQGRRPGRNYIFGPPSEHHGPCNMLQSHLLYALECNTNIKSGSIVEPMTIPDISKRHKKPQIYSPIMITPPALPKDSIFGIIVNSTKKVDRTMLFITISRAERKLSLARVQAGMHSLTLRHNFNTAAHGLSNASPELTFF